MAYKRVAQLRTLEQFKEYCKSIGAEMPVDETVETGGDAPLAQPYTYKDITLPNRFAVLPMEGWDGTADGHPSDLTRRRWQRFGQSGAKLIWGGEAVAVRHDGRANAKQLIINDDTVEDIAQLRQVLVDAHKAQFDTTDDLLIGIQLTHSGRFCRPNTKDLEPRVAYRHPLLDKKFDVDDDSYVFTDDEIDQLIEDLRQSSCAGTAGGLPVCRPQALSRLPRS